MKKLSDFKNEEALCLLADILDPMSEIVSDKEIRDLLKTGKGEDRIKAVSVMVKNHQKQIVEILARMDGQEPDGYSFGFFTLPGRILEVLNDPELTAFFTDPVIQSSEQSFGSHPENITESEN